MKHIRGWTPLKFSHVKILQSEVVVAHSRVVWTLPGSKIVVRALGKVRRWVGKCSSDFTQPYHFHFIVDQKKKIEVFERRRRPFATVSDAVSWCRG